MKLYKFKNIRTRLIYWFLLLSISPLLIALVVTYFQRIQVIETTSFNKLTAIRDLKVERLTDWLTERVSDIQTLSTDNEFSHLEQIINKTSFNQDDEIIVDNIRQHLNRYLLNYSAYQNIFIINPTNGQIVIATKEYLEGEDRSTAKYFTEPVQNGDLSIQDVNYSKTLGDYTMSYSIPIFGSAKNSKEIACILVVQINMYNSLFKMLLERVGLGETGETLIVNKDVVALNELRWYENAPLNLKIKAEPAVRSAIGETGLITAPDYRGVEVLSAYTYIPEMKWGFICKQDMYELNAPIRKMVWDFVLI